MWRVIFSLLALTADPDVWAFPTGAPTSVCDSMFPSHEAGAQGSLSPYELVVNKDTYAGGEEVQVTLKKIGDSWEFKGFFIQARKVDGSTEVHGKFTAVDSFTKTVSCGSAANSENAVTHRSSTSKPSVTVTWTAPSIPVGHIQFRATVVMTEKIFWVNVLSALVQDATDLPAGDLAGITLNIVEWNSGVTAEECQAACEMTPGCVGYDYDVAFMKCFLHFQTHPTTTKEPAK